LFSAPVTVNSNVVNKVERSVVYQQLTFLLSNTCGKAKKRKNSKVSEFEITIQKITLFYGET